VRHYKEIEIMSSTGIAVGLKKGFPVEKKEQAIRPSNKKGVS
jgi:cobalamin biosynthesis protein CbiD